MSKDASFDIVSDFDRQEMVNVIDQARREIGSRFDLKDSNTEIDLGETELTITTSDDLRLKNVVQIIEDKLIKRGLSANILDPKPEEHALGGRVRQVINLRKGIDKELAKKIVGVVKDTKLKVQASIQGDQVRVSGSKRDDLQAVIRIVREQADQWAVPLQFSNYR
jgi:uncharacterized protein YajQ (UPF0234 family)